MKAENLKEQDYYQTLIRSVTDYVLAINRNYQIIMANELFKKEFGMQPNALCYNIWKNRNEKCAECLIEKTFQDGQGHWNVEDMVMKNGRIAKMFVKTTPVKNEEGDIIYVLETATDISEREHLQEDLHELAGSLDERVAVRLKELQQSEEKYRTIFERSRDAIILIDPNGKIMETNQAMVNILGYNSQEEVLALESAAELFERKEFFEFQKQVSREGFVVEFETRLMGKNSQRLYVLITSNVMGDITGRITGFVLIIRDITKRKLAQKLIEQRNIRLDALNAISKRVSSSINLEEVLRSTIKKILKVLKNDSVRIYLLDDNKTLYLAAHKGLSDRFINKLHMRYRKIGEGLLGQALLDGQTRVADNFQRDRNVYVDSLIEEGLRSSAYIPLSTKGESIGVLVVSSRSSFKFSAEYVEFLSAIGNHIGIAVDNANMYENMKLAYRELKMAQEQMIQTEKLASLGKLAATIAHEINNPIAAVLTYTKLLAKLTDRNLFVPERLEDITRYLTTMESETARCGEIVKNLLAFSRQSKITIENHDIAGIIDRTLALISHDLEIKGIQFNKTIHPNLPEVKCDFKLIQQALLNIIYNASDAMPNGGILTVTADKSPGTRRSVEVAISDTGSGIAEEDLENIFEPFFTTKEEGKGVGLGLSVVYGIITRHNGTVAAESEPGKGSIFRVCLPFV